MLPCQQVNPGLYLFKFCALDQMNDTEGKKDPLCDDCQVKRKICTILFPFMLLKAFIRAISICFTCIACMSLSNSLSMQCFTKKSTAFQKSVSCALSVVCSSNKLCQCTFVHCVCSQIDCFLLFCCVQSFMF